MPVVPVTAQRRIRNPIPQKYVDQITKAAVFLINITDMSWVFQRTYGCYLIQPCEEGQEYTALRIGGRIETMDEGDSVSTQQLTEADAIAADLAMQANDGILVPEGTESFMGVFVSPTSTPDPKVLAKMKQKLMTFYDNQIRLADGFWDDPRDHKNISALHRRAAKARNQTRPWTYEAVNMESCPACGSNIKSGVAICGHCAAIIDEPKARKFFPERFATEAEPTPKQPRKKNQPEQQA